VTLRRNLLYEVMNHAEYQGDKIMLRTRHAHLLLLLLLATLFLAACGGAVAPAATPTTALSQPAPPAPEGFRTFAIVPAESKASYIVDEEFFADALSKYNIAAGKVQTIGSTQEIAGQLQLNLEDLSSPLGDNRFTVQINTLESDQALRDGWIRRNGPRLNDFPTAEFVATGIEGAPASYTEGEEVQFQLVGNLTMREITQPATFDVTATLQGDTITGKATARALLSDYGIEPPNFANTLVVGDEFMIEVDITAREE
jgi:polyisoprenoid-binding protein YceI